MSNLANKLHAASLAVRKATVAIVYAHSFDRGLLGKYYLKQRTETLSGYADVVDLLDAYPVFFNIEQFLDIASDPEKYKNIDYVINVPGGSLNIDHILLPAVIAAKIGKPVFPATAKTISVGQNKPIASCVAEACGWATPESLVDRSAISPDKHYIIKPTSAGDSYGVSRMSGRQILEKETPKDHFVQRFIEGYDLTTYVIRDPFSGNLVILNSSITIPYNQADTNWFWDLDRKFSASGRGVKRYLPKDHTREDRKSSEDFDRACIDLCSRLDVETLARIDTRLLKLPDASDAVKLSDALFLEINVLPSITPSGSWSRHIKRYLKSENIQHGEVHSLFDELPPMQSAMLFFILSWIGQSLDDSTTGVDQLK